MSSIQQLKDKRANLLAKKRLIKDELKVVGKELALKLSDFKEGQYIYSEKGERAIVTEITLNTQEHPVHYIRKIKNDGTPYRAEQRAYGVWMNEEEYKCQKKQK